LAQKSLARSKRKGRSGRLDFEARAAGMERLTALLRLLRPAGSGESAGLRARLFSLGLARWGICGVMRLFFNYLLLCIDYFMYSAND
jgi:hypothetical protein